VSVAAAISHKSPPDAQSLGRDVAVWTLHTTDGTWVGITKAPAWLVAWALVPTRRWVESAMPTRRDSIERGELTLEENSDGEWSPHIVARLGDLPAENIMQLADTLDLFDKRMVIDIADSSINWIGKNGKKNNFISGLYFDTEPLKLHSHDMRYFYLTIESGINKGARFRDIENEWLASKDIPYLPLYEKTGGDTAWDVAGSGEEK